jgi:hypothetical protein
LGGAILYLGRLGGERGVGEHAEDLAEVRVNLDLRGLLDEGLGNGVDGERRRLGKQLESLLSEARLGLIGRGRGICCDARVACSSVRQMPLQLMAASAVSNSSSSQMSKGGHGGWLILTSESTIGRLKDMAVPSSHKASMYT